MRCTPATLSTALSGLAALFAVGCGGDLDIPYGYDPGGVNCSTNSPPFIGHVEVDSNEVEALQTWVLTVHFHWADPGVDGASDPPNLSGGWFTIEIGGHDTEDFFLNDDILERACMTASVPGEGASDICDIGDHDAVVCVPDPDDPEVGIANCNKGSLTAPYVADPPFFEGQQLDMQFRVRDACGITSNEKGVDYAIGSGLQSEDDAGEGDDDDSGL